MFDDLIVDATARELAEHSWLVPARVFTASKRLDSLKKRTVFAGDYATASVAAVIEYVEYRPRLGPPPRPKRTPLAVQQPVDMRHDIR